MKTHFGTTFLVLTLAVPAFGQRDSSASGSGGPTVTTPPRGSFLRTPTPSPAPGPRSAPAGPQSNGDKQVYRADSVPAPTALDEIGPPKIVLPTGPIEPFLVQRENGPFMVLAYTFRGPDAARYAQALVLELKAQERLPSYIFFAKVQPGHSNVRGIQPTAPPYARNGDMAPPEKYRNYDEAAVLVGNCKTIDDARELLHRVKKLHPPCVDRLPSIYNWRRGRGLSRAIITTNPLVGSQYLYPGRNVPALKQGQSFDPGVVTAGFETIRKSDPLVKRINTGPHNIYKCRGPYLVQVAEFAGRTSLDPNDLEIKSNRGLEMSPLAAAGELAEKLADGLAKCKSLDKNLHPYVYHDRFASRVYIGPFQSAQDPALIALLRDPVTGNLSPNQTPRPGQTQTSKIVEISNELINRNLFNRHLVTAGELTAVGKD